MSDLFYSSLYYFSTCRQWCPPPHKALSPSVEVFLPVFFLTNMRIECFSVAYQQGGTVVAGWLGFFFFLSLPPLDFQNPFKNLIRRMWKLLQLLFDLPRPVSEGIGSLVLEGC